MKLQNGRKMQITGGLPGLRLVALLLWLLSGAFAAISVAVLLLVLRTAGLFSEPVAFVVFLGWAAAGLFLAAAAVGFELTTESWRRLNLQWERDTILRVLFPLMAGVVVFGGGTHVYVLGSGDPAGISGLLLLPTLVAAGAGFVVAARVLNQIIRYLRRRERMCSVWRALLSKGAVVPALDRVKAFLECEEVRGGGSGFPQIRGFSFPGLTATPFHDTERFPWVRQLEAAFPVIRTEVLAAVEGRVGGLRPYPFAGNTKWLECPLFKGGVKVMSNCALCPETVRLIETVVPGGPVREVTISILEPGARIDPHIDHTIPLLTCHLAVVIPDGCGIRSCIEERQWHEGACLVLDTSFEHEAWNDSGERRIVLFFDFWPPELSEVERGYFSGAFQEIMRPHLKEIHAGD